MNNIKCGVWYEANVNIIFKNNSGPKGFEFELLGGCGEVIKSLAKTHQINGNIYPGRNRLFIIMCYV